MFGAVWLMTILISKLAQALSSQLTSQDGSCVVLKRNPMQKLFFFFCLLHKTVSFPMCHSFVQNVFWCQHRQLKLVICLDQHTVIQRMRVSGNLGGRHNWYLSNPFLRKSAWCNQWLLQDSGRWRQNSRGGDGAHEGGFDEMKARLQLRSSQGWKKRTSGTSLGLYTGPLLSSKRPFGLTTTSCMLLLIFQVVFSRSLPLLPLLWRNNIFWSLESSSFSRFEHWANCRQCRTWTL